MKKLQFAMLFIGFVLTVTGWTQNEPITKANYQLAGRFSPKKIEKMVFSTNVDPHWLKLSDRFWYTYETSEGKSFYIVDPAKKTKLPLFDNIWMAAALTRHTRDPYDEKHLPVDRIHFIDNETAIRFMVESTQDEEADTTGASNKENGKKKKEKKKFYFRYDLNTKQLSILDDYEPPKDRPRWASISPDESIIVFSRRNNLFWMDEENYRKALEDEKDTTIVEHQLTTDGIENYGYGGSGRGEDNVEKEKNKDERKPAYIIWSPDSKKFATIRTDSREVKDLWVINSVARPRPTLETYKYHMPGEKEAPQQELLVFDLTTKEKLVIQSEGFKDQTISINTAQRMVNQRDDEFVPRIWLSSSPDKLYFTRTSRDLKRIDFCLANTHTGEVMAIIEERLNTYVETRRPGMVNDGEEIIHWSERDGWAHFYLYDENGQLKNQITRGPFHCEDIIQVDEKNRVLFFTANAHETNEDPYYLHLYRVNFDGSDLRLLNPGNYNHYVSMCDSRKFILDNYSRVNSVPTADLRDNLGNVLMPLETTDLSLLFQAGYQFPEPFKVKADDGITDLYGVLYKPFDFDSSRLYPIITYVYPGPQTEAVNKSFSSRMDRTDRLAQFGFIVVTVGNRGGHPSRSKWYHNYGYGNLRDYGLADKKAAIEQLADRFDYIDIDKVGIFGHSGGGFMSTAAMLIYPDFFKVAVSSSGNHENNIYNRWWSEKHHGVEEVVDKDGNITFEYDIDKNSEIAENLKGRLLICTGEMDNNVHPANTITLANALIKANKRFDFFIFPGQRHGYGNMTEYFFWLRGDYFCRYLIGDFVNNVDIIEMNKEIEMN